MNKKTFPLFLSLLAGLVLFLGTVFKVGLITIIKVFSELSILAIFVLIVISALVCFINVYRWKILLEDEGATVKWKSIIFAWLTGFSMSYLTPIVNLGGEPLRIYVLRCLTKVSWDKAVASTVIDKAFDLTFNLFFVILGAGFFIFYSDVHLSLKIFVFVFISILIFLTCLFYSRTLRKKNYLLPLVKFFGFSNNEKWVAGKETVQKTERIIHDFFDLKKSIFWQSFLLTFFRSLLHFARVALIIFFLYNAFSFKNTLIINSSIFLVGSLPIPGAFGSQEISQAYLFSSLNGGAEVGVAFSLISRILDLIFVGLGLFVIFHFSFKNMLYKMTGWIKQR